ncbi:MAG: COR domain-containing protein, partial [Cyanobacteria bacterium P01_D01_bin.115]
ILRPEWATNAVYAIVNNDIVAAAKGLFTRTDAETIWAEANYANLGDELLQLMENFNLCYPIPGLPDAYIAPQLLDFEPPPYDWANTNTLTLRYEYEFMPKGILTQLIVRLYRWIEQQQIVWRSGVVLTNGRARAEIIETYRPYKGEIRLCVSGVHNKELLSIIANEIDQINNSFEKIKVTQKIPCNCEECQVDDEPHYFRLQTLDRFLAKGRTEVACEKSALDVPIRSLTAVIPTSEIFIDPNERLDNDRRFLKSEEQAKQETFDYLKQQHTEYYPVGIDLLGPATLNPATVNYFHITGPVQFGDHSVIEQHANDPHVITVLSTTLKFLQDLQQKHPNLQESNAQAIIESEVSEIQQRSPDRWQQFQQQLRSLPQDIRNPERLMQAGKASLFQVATDLSDNLVLNAFIAFLDGLSSDPS